MGSQLVFTTILKQIGIEYLVKLQIKNLKYRRTNLPHLLLCSLAVQFVKRFLLNLIENEHKSCFLCVICVLTFDTVLLCPLLCEKCNCS